MEKSKLTLMIYRTTTRTKYKICKTFELNTYLTAFVKYLCRIILVEYLWCYIKIKTFASQ